MFEFDPKYPIMPYNAGILDCLCLVCGNLSTPNLNDTAGGNNPIYSAWLHQCTESLMQVLQLDSSFYATFENGSYCSECLGDIREINFLIRNIKTLEQRVSYYQDKVVMAFRNKYLRIQDDTSDGKFDLQSPASPGNDDYDSQYSLQDQDPLSDDHLPKELPHHCKKCSLEFPTRSQYRKHIQHKHSLMPVPTIKRRKRKNSPNSDDEEIPPANQTKTGKTRVREQRKWTTEDLGRVVSYLKDAVLSNSGIGKPSFNAYYAKMITDLNLTDLTVDQLRSRINYLRTSYCEANNWRGKAVLEDVDAEFVRAQILKKCPFYDELKMIYGRNPNPGGDKRMSSNSEVSTTPEYLPSSNERLRLGTHRLCLQLPEVPVKASELLVHCHFDGCIYTRPSQDKVDEHVRRVHTGDAQPYHCERCPEKFETATHYRQHKKESHAGFRLSTCEVCGYAFEHDPENAALNSHMDLHRNREGENEKFACVLANCGQVCKSSVELKKHVLAAHDVLGLLQCKYCITKFKWKGGLTDHVRNFHLGTLDPLKCNICRYRATTKEDFDTHWTAHEKPQFVCSECGRSFRWRTSFRNHCLQHAPPETWPLKCSFADCNRRFVRKADLAQHEAAHDGRKFYTCPTCSQSYTRMTHLKRHIAQKHPT